MQKGAIVRLELTPSQAAQIAPHLLPGIVMLGRVDREAFTGTNAGTCGTLTMIFASIPTERIEAVRAAIAGTPAPAEAARKARRAKA